MIQLDAFYSQRDCFALDRLLYGRNERAHGARMMIMMTMLMLMLMLMLILMLLMMEVMNTGDGRGSMTQLDSQ